MLERRVAVMCHHPLLWETRVGNSYQKLERESMVKQNILQVPMILCRGAHRRCDFTNKELGTLALHSFFHPISWCIFSRLNLTGNQRACKPICWHNLRVSFSRQRTKWKRMENLEEEQSDHIQHIMYRDIGHRFTR